MSINPGGCIVEFVDETGNVLALLDVTNLAELVPLNLKLRAAQAKTKDHPAPKRFEPTGTLSV